MMRTFRTTLLVFGAVVALLASPLLGAAQEMVPTPRTISTAGVGTVTVEPDSATFSVGMEARNENLKAAQDEVTGEANAITEYLRGAGLEEKDIVTSSYQAEPVNKYDRNGNFVEIEGYIVRLAITVTSRDMDQVGTLLDQAVKLGADFVSPISFFVSNPDPYIEEARKLAISDARSSAELYAEGSGMVITGLQSLWETSATDPMAREAGSSDTAMMDTAAAPVEQESTPVEVSPGSTTITVRIETTWTVEVADPAIAPESTPAN